MSNLLTTSNSNNIGNEKACLCTRLCVRALTSGYEMRLEVKRNEARERRLSRGGGAERHDKNGHDKC